MSESASSASEPDDDVALVDVETLRRHALTMLVNDLQLEAVQDALQVMRGYAWRYHIKLASAEIGRYIGRFHAFGRVFSCTCQHGGGCKLMVNFRSVEHRCALEAFCLKWLVQGLYQSKDEHVASLPEARLLARRL